jgi:hypothetical protein
MSISDFFTVSDITTALSTVLGDVGPYVLAVFGLTLTVGIAMALLSRTKRQVTSHIK